MRDAEERRRRRERGLGWPLGGALAVAVAGAVLLLSVVDCGARPGGPRPTPSTAATPAVDGSTPPAPSPIGRPGSPTPPAPPPAGPATTGTPAPPALAPAGPAAPGTPPAIAAPSATAAATPAAPATVAPPSPPSAGPTTATAPPPAGGDRGRDLGLTPAQEARGEALLRRLTLREKVGQMLMLGFVGTTVDDGAPLLRSYAPGSIILLQNAVDAAQTARLTGGLQQIAAASGAKVPLFIAIDH